AALRGDSRAGSLVNFEDALRALAVEYRGHHEQEVGRVGRGVFVIVGRFATAGMWSDERAVFSDENLVQQAAVLVLTDLIIDEASLLQIDLIGQLQSAG